MREGRDPAAERKAERARIAAAEAEEAAQRARHAFTVEVLLERWATDHLAARSAAYRLEAPRRLRAALAGRLDAPADSLVLTDAVAALDRVKSEAGPVQANRVRAYARAAFGWAMRRGSLAANPFADAPRPAKETARERALTVAELGEVWRAAGMLGAGLRDDHAEQASYWTALLRLLLLTGQRRGEVAGMRWSELRLVPRGEATWVLPGCRTKNGREHEVPLAPPALAILESLPRVKGCDLVLSGGRPNPPTGFGKMKQRLDAAIARARAEAAAEGEEVPSMPEFTLHDLRRSVATGLQRLHVRLEVTEALLNHVSGTRSGMSGIYQRHRWAGEGRAAAEAWAVRILHCADAAVAT